MTNLPIYLVFFYPLQKGIPTMAGLINSFFQRASASIKGVMGNAEKLMNNNIKDAILAVLAQVVMADGTASEVEIRKAAACAANHSALKKYSEAEITGQLMKNCTDLQNSAYMAKLQLDNAVKALVGKHDESMLAIAMACDIAASDGDFAESEKTVIRAQCTLLSVNPADFGL